MILTTSWHSNRRFDPVAALLASDRTSTKLCVGIGVGRPVGTGEGLGEGLKPHCSSQNLSRVVVGVGVVARRFLNTRTLSLAFEPELSHRRQCSCRIDRNSGRIPTKAIQIKIQNRTSRQFLSRLLKRANHLSSARLLRLESRAVLQVSRTGLSVTVLLLHHVVS